MFGGDVLRSLQSRPHILVVGDLMLDRFVSGDITRISPEAPVPVFRQTAESMLPGGAANVAVGLARLNSSVTIVGVVGSDQAAANLGELLAAESVASRVITTGRRTTVKSRLLSGNHQVIRVDDEVLGPLEARAVELLVAALRELPWHALQGVVISDYAKGVCDPAVCREVMDLAGQRGIPVFVDPKGSEWGKYRGAYLVTPNLKELSLVAGREVENGDEQVAEAAAEVRDANAIENLLVTRSEKGMTLLHDHEIQHIKGTARRVFDVTGAGDTVIATLARMVATGVKLPEAAAVANRAAGFVVGQFGTYCLRVDELVALADGSADDYSAAVVDFGRVPEVVGKLREQGKVIVFTNGCFDILHSGHLYLLNQARSLGDVLIVGLNSDESVRRLKGEGRPVNNARSRSLALANLKSVDYVVVFSEDTPTRLAEQIRPDYLVKGGEYSLEQIPGREFAKETVVFQMKDGISTTGIIRNLQGKA